MALSLKVHHLARYRDIAALLLKHGRAGGLPDGNSRDHADEDTANDEDARTLVDALESMGPTFVKLGQLLSTRADLLPPVYLDALARLQDDVEALPFDVIEATVTAEIGARMSKAFQSFDTVPVASASLGQVHRATLRDSRRVAVKVQRPGVRERVVEDMKVIEELAEFVDLHTEAGRSFGFGGMVEEFRRSIMAELDYRLEAANLRLLGSNLAAYDRITVPQPIDDYTTALVLTMDLVDGRNVGSLGPLARQEIDGQALAAQLFDCYLDQILVDGFVHADPHPGNV
ncbi:MAG: ABC1 kinase family protein, partial [Ilumatobacteraceae bacterium]